MPPGDDTDEPRRAGTRRGSRGYPAPTDGSFPDSGFPSDDGPDGSFPGDDRSGGGYPSDDGSADDSGGYLSGNGPAGGGYPLGGGTVDRGGYPLGGGAIDRGGYPLGGGTVDRGGYPLGGAAVERGGYPLGGGSSGWDDGASGGGRGRSGRRRGSERGQGSAERGQGAAGRGQGAAGRNEPPRSESEVAREICLRQLAVRPRTRAELAKVLVRKEISEEVIAEVLDRYDEVGIIDDAAFARAWVSSRHHGRGLARRALANELRQRGVDAEVADEALEVVDEEAEAAAARALVDRKLRTARGEPDAIFRRLVAMLARKGYPAGIAIRAVKDALAARDAEAAEFADAIDPDALADDTTGL